MSDLLDGPVIDGPRIAASGAAELDDTPGAILPCEWLHESPQWTALTRRQKKLYLVSSQLSGSSGLNALASATDGQGRRSISPVTKDRIEAAILVAEYVLDRIDSPPHPTPPPAQPAAVDPAPQVDLQRKYLEWLRDLDGSCLVSESPPGMSPSGAEITRRHLLKRGLLAATHKGGAVEATGYAMTAQGWNSVEPVGGGAGRPG